MYLAYYVSHFPAIFQYNNKIKKGTRTSDGVSHYFRSYSLRFHNDFGRK